MAALLLLVAACAPPPLAGGPSPSSRTSPAAAVSPDATPTSEATATSATGTPTRGPVLTITNATFHAGEIGVAYSAVTLSASGGVPPYSWSISAGSLPSGLSVASGGTVSGTPTGAGTFAFTVHVADAVGGSAIVNRSIAVANHMALTALCGGPACNVEQGCITVCGAFGTLTGGVSGFSYKVTAGAVPPGMTLSGLSLAGPFPPPKLSALGAPLPYALTVTVTDALGATASVTAGFTVFKHIAWVVSSATCAAASVPYQCSTNQLTYSGGTPGGTPSVKVTATSLGYLPPGFSATAKGGVVTVSVSSVNTKNYFGTVTLVLIDQSPCAPGANCQTPTAATVTIRV